MSITLAIIGIVVCVLILSYIKTKEEWNEKTKPPKGWIQHNGIRTRIKQ